MKKKTPISKKRRGPAPTGVGKAQLVRMHDQLITEIDAWRVAQDGELTRPEAIRQLVEIGLSRSKPRGATSVASAERAVELAAKAVDTLIDPATAPEDKAQRKRRLIKGPSDFRDVRADAPKRR